MRPIVSVVIPAFQRQRQLDRAIASVLAQSGIRGSAIEIIVVDDCSPSPLAIVTNSSAQLIRQYQNGGAAAARNKGVAMATGDLIAFLDSDDVWLPNKLANQLASFAELSKTHDPDLLAIGTGFYDPDRKTGVLRSRIPRASSTVELFSSGCWFGPGSTLLMSRKAFDAIGPQDAAMRRLEDLDWFIRFGQAGGKFFSTQTRDVVIRPSGTAPFDAVMTAAQQLADKYGPSGTTPLPARAWNRLAAYLSLEKAVAHHGKGQFFRSSAELLKTFIRKPRFQPALETFWDESADIPDVVRQTFAQMEENLS